MLSHVIAGVSERGCGFVGKFFDAMTIRVESRPVLLQRPKCVHITVWDTIYTRDLVRFGSYYENSPKASGFFLILKFNSNLPKKTEV